MASFWCDRFFQPQGILLLLLAPLLIFHVQKLFLVVPSQVISQCLGGTTKGSTRLDVHCHPLDRVVLAE